jgi:glucan 1,3-beta-glucosidase
MFFKVSEITSINLYPDTNRSGCTLLEVNIAGSSPGDVGFWNTHFRVGGAAGSKVETNCAGAAASCKAAYLLLHLTSTSSAYVENMWGKLLSVQVRDALLT